MTQGTTSPERATTYAWVVFALTFGLLLSDYMSRQVLSAVFPMLKTEWRVTDGELGVLSGVVGLAVGLLSAPLSYLADRVGRLRSLVAMALVWSVATLACGMARNYHDMLIARVFVGAGEAAYGSVGAALVVSMFPAHRRATITAAFLAGATVGSVAGVSAGGLIARAWNWRAAFTVMACVGLALALVYPLVVRGERKGAAEPPVRLRTLVGLLNSPTLVATYIAGGAQLLISAALIAWLPSYLVRSYALAPDRAALAAGGFLLVSSVGSIACGVISDRFARNRPERLLTFAAMISVATFALVALAFVFSPGAYQLALLALGMTIAGGAMGASSAAVAALTDPRVRGSAFALIALGNNIFGIAPGPVLSGRLADTIGLAGALQWASVASVAAAGIFLFARLLWPETASVPSR